MLEVNLAKANAEKADLADRVKYLEIKLEEVILPSSESELPFPPYLKIVLTFCPASYCCYNLGGVRVFLLVSPEARQQKHLLLCVEQFPSSCHATFQASE